MQISLSTEYAIHSLFYLALQDKDDVTLVSEVASVQNISQSYLAKIFQILAKAGLVKSYRGAKGGYVLASSPKEISLKKIVETMEGKSSLFICDEERRKCHFSSNCEIHAVMDEAERKMFEVLENTTLADLASKLKSQTSAQKYKKKIR